MTHTASLFVFLFALALSQGYGGTLKLGVPESGDQPLQRLHLTMPVPGPDERLGAVFEMRTLQGPQGAIISQVVIEDRASGCATATPINGGPGSTFVVLRIVAPKDCSIDFMFEVYGKFPAEAGW